MAHHDMAKDIHDEDHGHDHHDHGPPSGIMRWIKTTNHKDLGTLYLWLFLDSSFAGNGVSFEDFTTLAGVMKLFMMKEVAVAGWVHYLVFDLFVGAWIGRDAQRCAVPHLLVVPCLLLTLLLGPLGLLAYLLLRGILNRGGWQLFEG